MFQTTNQIGFSCKTSLQILKRSGGYSFKSQSQEYLTLWVGQLWKKVLRGVSNVSKQLDLFLSKAVGVSNDYISNESTLASCPWFLVWPYSMDWCKGTSTKRPDVFIIKQGLANVPMFHITQLLGIFHLQQIFVLVMFKIPKKGHLPTPVKYDRVAVNCPIQFYDVAIPWSYVAMDHEKTIAFWRRWTSSHTSSDVNRRGILTLPDVVSENVVCPLLWPSSFGGIEIFRQWIDINSAILFRQIWHICWLESQTSIDFVVPLDVHRFLWSFEEKWSDHDGSWDHRTAFCTRYLWATNFLGGTRMLKPQVNQSKQRSLLLSQYRITYTCPANL